MSEEEDDANEIGQISVYLLRSGFKLSDAIDPEKNIESASNFVRNQFEVDDTACEWIYFESITNRTNPPWLDFLNGKIGKESQILFSEVGRNPNGLISIEIEDRTFVATFGRSANSYILRDKIVKDFGIKTAMNMCGNEEIRQTRTQNFSITPTHIDRQVSRPSDAFSFGIDDAEDLKAISAHMKGDARITLQGRDNLTIKVIGSDKLTWESLVNRCGDFLEAYEKHDFIELFPNYRNFKPAKSSDIEKLDELLINKIKSEDLSGIEMWVPEFLLNDDFSFTYSDHSKAENTVYAYLSVSQLKDQMQINKLSSKSLRSRRIIAFSHHEDRVVSSKYWSVYQCLIWEHQLDDDYFLLADGEWRIVDKDFYDEVTEYVQHKVREEPCEPEFENINIADIAISKNTEQKFNEEVCKRRPESVLFDRSKLKIGKGRKDKEFCDVLDYTENGVVRIINCKPLGGASSITYAFAQTKLYCEAFLRDQTFLNDIRDHISASKSTKKSDYLDYIASNISDVHGNNFHVCVWLLYNKNDTKPTRSSLPLIAQYELKRMHENLRQICKYQEIIVRFIPVERVNFVKAKAPKKA